ncbi:type II secretion system protein GspD [Uliginosibacterium paludis]|uniref:Type II and III secretion system protein n=1 Tax=Uliginosibacterium paludis TaxID=1615952 RepID=A0ABV2CV69_9RHOO
MRFHYVPAAVLSLGISACAQPHEHLTQHTPLEHFPHLEFAAAQKPSPAKHTELGMPELPPQRPEKLLSISVNRISVQSLLSALARDSNLDIDIHPSIEGIVTLNAVNQTLSQLLERITRQVNIRYEQHGTSLAILPDEPYFRYYRIDYVNLARDTSSIVSLASQIGSSAAGKQDQQAPQASSGSFAQIHNTSNNRIWSSIVQNLAEILQDGTGVPTKHSSECPGINAADATKTAHCAPSAHSAHSLVMANPETGVLSIRATARQHAQVKTYLEDVLSRARRQVLIEATIAEVELTQNYQQGIDWTALNLFDTGFRFVQRAVGTFSGSNAIPSVELGYDSRGGNFIGAVKLLETFGTVRVLSSPKLSVLNNQTAVMKVVDDNIYFTYEIKETDATSNSPARKTVNSTLHSVPVGIVLTITPMVGDDESVTLNIRPSMSRVIGQKVDPSLQLIQGNATIMNTIPVIRAREFDSVMRIANGNIAVMGGLMEDATDNNDGAVPVIASLPLIGRLFESRNDSKRKTQLVIFVRPTILPAVMTSSDPERLG